MWNMGYEQYCSSSFAYLQWNMFIQNDLLSHISSHLKGSASGVTLQKWFSYLKYAYPSLQPSFRQPLLATFSWCCLQAPWVVACSISIKYNNRCSDISHDRLGILFPLALLHWQQDTMTVHYSHWWLNPSCNNECLFPRNMKRST